MAYEHEMAAFVRNRSGGDLPRIPDFLLKLTRGHIQNLKSDGKTPTYEEVTCYLDKVCKSRARAKEILQQLQKEGLIVGSQDSPVSLRLVE